MLFALHLVIVYEKQGKAVLSYGANSSSPPTSPFPVLLFPQKAHILKEGVGNFLSSNIILRYRTKQIDHKDQILNQIELFLKILSNKIGDLSHLSFRTKHKYYQCVGK